MNKTMMNLMKPLPITATKNGIKAEQEIALMDFLSTAEQSVSVNCVLCNIGKFPGCDEPVLGTEYYRIYRNIKMRSISATFGRLESQGRVISTRFGGRRYYSIPVEN